MRGGEKKRGGLPLLEGEVEELMTLCAREKKVEKNEMKKEKWRGGEGCDPELEFPFILLFKFIESAQLKIHHT